MPDSYLVVESGQTGNEGRRRISVDEDDVGLYVLHHAVQPFERSRRHFRQCLAVFHDVQVVIRRNVENIQHLIQHLAVLCCHGDDRFNVFGIFLQFQH